MGDDGFGREIRETLDRSGVDTGGLRTVEGPSGIAQIVVQDGGANSIVVVPGANGAVTERDAAGLTGDAPAAAARTADARRGRGGPSISRVWWC